MKKSLILAFLMFTMAASTYAGKVVTISVEFGSGPYCSGRGICKITVGVGNSATLQINDVSGSLLMTVTKGTAIASAFEQLPDGSFEVTADYAVPSNVCEALGIDSYVIRKGVYQVTETNNAFSVIFTNPVSKLIF